MLRLCPTDTDECQDSSMSFVHGGFFITLEDCNNALTYITFESNKRGHCISTLEVHPRYKYQNMSDCTNE